jgi:hypothetical protein
MPMCITSSPSSPANCARTARRSRRPASRHFPGGSITGAPKIAPWNHRRIEKRRRAASIADRSATSASTAATCDFNIAIRTAQLAGGMVRVQGGGGITARSHPAAEYEESLTKISPPARITVTVPWGTPMILIVDNYDSFVHNVARYFEELGEPHASVRNDAVTRRPEGQGHRHFAGSLHAHEAGSPWTSCANNRATSHPRHLPRPSGDGRGLRRSGEARAGAPCMATVPRSTMTARTSSQACRNASAPDAITPHRGARGAITPRDHRPQR